jgi:hypothetical protein
MIHPGHRIVDTACPNNSLTRRPWQRIANISKYSPVTQYNAKNRALTAIFVAHNEEQP